MACGWIMTVGSRTELMHGLMCVDPSMDWQTHLMQLRPIDSPKALTRLAKQKFADSIQEFDMDPTDPECPHRQHSSYCQLMHHAHESKLLVAPAYISADMPLCKKQAIARVRLSAVPIRCNTSHGVQIGFRYTFNALASDVVLG